MYKLKILVDAKKRKNYLLFFYLFNHLLSIYNTFNSDTNNTLSVYC